MNGRLSLTEIAAHLTAAVLVGAPKVGTAYDRDFPEAFGKVWPAVWVLAQRLKNIDDGDGYSGVFRQRCRIDIAVRIVVQRYADGVVSGEAGLNALFDAVSESLKDYKVTGADVGFSWVQSQDGPPAESVMAADMVYTTTVTYARVIP